MLIAEGEVEVSVDGRHLRTCGPGDGIGEIAVLRRVPRTASVFAKTDVSAFEIDGAAFLAAVSGPAAAATAEAVATARLEHSPAEELGRPPAQTATTGSPASAIATSSSE